MTQDATDDRPPGNAAKDGMKHQRIRGETEQDDVIGRRADVLRYVDGAWKIAHLNLKMILSWTQMSCGPNT
jgi:hypothetical protein